MLRKKSSITLFCSSSYHFFSFLYWSAVYSWINKNSAHCNIYYESTWIINMKKAIVSVAPVRALRFRSKKKKKSLINRLDRHPPPQNTSRWQVLTTSRARMNVPLKVANWTSIIYQATAIFFLRVLKIPRFIALIITERLLLTKGQKLNIL